MTKKNSIKAGKPDPNQPKISARIDDLYWLELGKPPTRHWFIDFNYTMPRSPVVHHDWESIEMEVMPTPEDWAKRILTRFDCLSERSLVTGIRGWIAKHRAS